MKNTSFPKDPYVAATFVTVNVLQFLATLVSNVLLCVAVYKYHALRTLANAFLVSLAVADLLFLVIFPSNIVHFTSEGKNSALCFISAELSNILTCLVVLHLMAIAVERLLAITLHLRYREVVTDRKVAIAIASIWIFGIVEATLPTMMASSNMTKEQTHDVHKMRQGCLSSKKLFKELSRDAKNIIIIERVVAYAVPYVVILLCYAWIFKISWRHHRQINNQRMPRNTEHERITKIEMKAAKTTAIIVGTFVVTFTPLLAVTVQRVFKKPPKTHDHHFMRIVIPSLQALAAMSAFLNPLVYAWRNEPFRRAFGAILQPFCSLLPSRCGSCVSRETEQNN